jgi:hypothetical protein
MRQVVHLSTLTVAAMLLLTSFDRVCALPLTQGPVLGWGESFGLDRKGQIQMPARRRQARLWEDEDRSAERGRV